MGSDKESSERETYDGAEREDQVQPHRRRRKPRIAPCTNCREKHLKCDEGSICKRCDRDGEVCIRPKASVRFRTGSRAKYDTTFSKDQTWTKPARRQKLQYVQETGGGAALHSGKAPGSQDGQTDNPAAEVLNAPENGSTPWPSNDTDLVLSDPVPGNSGWTPSLDDGAGVLPTQSSPEWIVDPNPALSATSRQNEQLQGQYDHDPDHTLLQAVLLRYFIDNLARWFDLCDPEKHFELVVPQRARQCPPLMNAILTASARHLTRAPEDMQIFMAPRLAELNPETAVHFHNQAIQDLIKFSVDPDQIQNENLLAAAIILRFYEEIDAPLREDEKDSELFLRVTSLFITEQFPVTPHVPHSSPLINYSSRTHGTLEPSLQAVNSPGASSRPTSSLPETLRSPRPEGLRQAGFWVAFRQEIYTCFLKQRAFTIPLSHCDGFRSWAPAEDAVWADRMIVFCADVIDFCYGSTDSTDGGTAVSPNLATFPPASAADRWHELKHTEQLWNLHSPASFAPIYSRDADRTCNEVFPEIWYLSDCHVTGLQHLELARILLAVHDPTRPKLGPGHFASLKQLSRTLKAIVLKLCGMAMGNRKTPPALVTAHLGIATCGDHFEDRTEQEALLGLLEVMQEEYGWPGGRTAEGLKDAWGWYDRE